MTKAQKIRSKRLKKLDEAINAEAEKIFDWILDLMDVNTEKGYFGGVDLFLWDDKSSIKELHNEEVTHDLTDVLLKYDRNKLFTTLAKLIDNEEGYKVTLNLNAYIWESKAILLSVVME